MAFVTSVVRNLGGIHLIPVDDTGQILSTNIKHIYMLMSNTVSTFISSNWGIQESVTP